ncbi:MAG: AI-2E family transporter [Acidimicrobiales bacterium]
MSNSTSDGAVEAQPPQRMPRWVRDAILWWWGILVVLWLALGITRELRGLLTQLALALFLSLAMEPLVDRLGRRGVKRGVATALAMLVLAVSCIAFVVAMGSLVASQLRQLAQDLPGYVTSAEEWAEDRFNVEIESADVIDQLGTGSQTSEYLSSVADNLVGVGAGVLSAIFQLLTIALFAFYFTADGPRLRRAICSVLPPARQHEVLRVWELAIDKSGAFLAARFILAVISAAVHWVAFAVLGLPSALALALWVGIVSQFIPVIGIYIAGVLPALIALGIEPTKALWVLLVIVVYQQIENYGLQPRVTAQTLNMHPAVAFAAVLAGSAMFGASGALLALPFLATVQSFISAYVARHNVVESRLTPVADEESAEEGLAEDHQSTEGC